MGDPRWEHIRKTVLSRDGNMCLRCLEPAAHVHHRRPKGMGGTSDEVIKYGLANLVSVCFSCHELIHRRPALAYETGFLVHAWDNPEAIPLRVGSYSQLLKLSVDGGIERIGESVLF